jgi:transcriptional antiterminator RfaH
MNWYALYTRSRHENRVEDQLAEKGFDAYLPERRVLRRWSDRKKWIMEPLFRCYVFVRMDEKDRVRVLQTYGSVRLVSFSGKPAIVQDHEIETIRRVLQEIPAVESCPPVSVGDWVEITGGPLIGIRGRLEEIRNQKRLVVSVNAIEQAFRFVVEGTDIRVIHDS